MAFKRVAVFGATGLEGESLLEALSESDLGIESASVFAVDAEGETAMFKGRPVGVKAPTDADFSAVDLAIFLPEVGSDPSLVDDACDAGIVVLDATDTLAQRDDVQVFCEGEAVVGGKCFAIADAPASHIAALLKQLPPSTVSRVDVSLAQAVSVAGRDGIEALAAETARLLGGQTPDKTVLGQQIAFNVLPQPADRAAAELEHNLSRLLGDGVTISANVMMVPVFYGHTIMLRVGCVSRPDLAELKAGLSADSRFRLFPNDDAEQASPVCLQGSECIDIDQLNYDRREETAFRCTVVGDNLRKGAVFNIIELLKNLIKINI
ncbi:Asd/ArgC dimerization domain-containing protein [Zhongshania sp.]|uniref:Asd/ArgC dimerization domain-containing protein n=1 Tax=Zhongshania sp. TaxID=1971902 RepID=UPI0035623FEB